jgi:Mor family transcriptional regulator
MEVIQMNYTKATDILPQHLLEEVQSYIDGTLLYIPKTGNKVKWGTHSGTREMLQERNKGILTCYQQGASICDLADMYHLCDDTIKKIVYGKCHRKEAM